MAEPKLLDRLSRALRVRHYSIRTEEAYVQWVRRFILFHHKRHPKDMGEAEITAFLSHLAVDRNVAASTQNQALSAILFLYKVVLEKELEWLDDVVRATRPKRLPTVLTRDEVRNLLGRMNGVNQLVAELMYGTGMRLMEALRLRIQDVDFGYHQIIVRAGKGNKDRVTLLPRILEAKLQQQIKHAIYLHQKDLSEGFGRVYLPNALSKKYPSADREPGWQYVFPSVRRSADPHDGIVRRHHLHDKNLQRALKRSARELSMTRRISSHVLP